MPSSMPMLPRYGQLWLQGFLVSCHHLVCPRWVAMRPDRRCWLAALWWSLVQAEQAARSHLGQRRGALRCGVLIVVDQMYTNVTVRVAQVVVANRNRARSEALVAEMGQGATVADWEAVQQGDVQGDVLANTTSVGMAPNDDATPVPGSALGAFQVSCGTHTTAHPKMLKLKHRWCLMRSTRLLRHDCCERLPRRGVRLSLGWRCLLGKQLSSLSFLLANQQMWSSCDAPFLKRCDYVMVIRCKLVEVAA